MMRRHRNSKHFVLRIDFSFSYSVFIDPRAMRVACHSVPVLPPPAVMRPTIVSPSMRPLNSSRELTRLIRALAQS
jgi:hypothetical protein